ncbi:MAG: putative sensor domain DACNV-containing protein [Gemmatimonas sp.]
MSSSRLPAAQQIAERVVSHLARQMAKAHLGGLRSLATVPAVVDLEQVIDSAFWASLRHEEGYLPRISLALAPPSDCEKPLLFSRYIDLSSAALARIAPAVERPGIHLGVWPVNGTLYVWGTTRIIPPFCAVVEVTAPGVLVFKHRHLDDTVKYVNMAVLDGDEVKVVDESVAAPGNCPQLVSFLMGYESRTSQRNSGNVLVQLAVSMRAHRRGGILLIVPEDSDWMSSMAQPLAYEVRPAYTTLADALRQNVKERSGRLWDESVRLAVEHVGGLTAVDGATVVTSGYEVLAFGAKIVRHDQAEQVTRVLMTEPIEGREPRILNAAQMGGTRHLSAAQFVHDQRDAVALVASVDGRFTVFEWSVDQDVVHGHRVETLLL